MLAALVIRRQLLLRQSVEVSIDQLVHVVDEVVVNVVSFLFLHRGCRLATHDILDVATPWFYEAYIIGRSSIASSVVSLA